ncbi:hypothetical protein AELL_0238 [Arcobacter ellisii]|uniref:Uncharacterized protein n=1 Tax=Arcobacter ellisii TaxID=913109 RepID=A0A347U515_9BACT|nr:hypothetical protein [Arcobacter ellisii]AXX93943.1 hypothetical protein AELL_0238 [Arcobacter ellisii]RXI33135.1 hypothetical protein CP962_01625 [Arcobacter ellisii]
MILNVSKIKTESLLLFCKDLILSYKDRVDVNDYGMDKEVIEKFNNIGNDMLKQILNVTFPQNYYLQNRKHYRIKAVLDGYNFINDEISKNLKENEAFNPSMLYFSLLAVWFKELNKESRSKEYIYFLLYPYSQVYDKLLIEIKNKEFRALNIKMIELAENVIYKFDKYNFVK